MANQLLPLLVAKNQVLFSEGSILLEIGSDESKKIINSAVKNFNKKIIIVPSINPIKTKDEIQSGKSSIGIIASFSEIEKIGESNDEIWNVVFTGMQRVYVNSAKPKDKVNLEHGVEYKLFKQTSLNLEIGETALNEFLSDFDFDIETKNVLNSHFKANGLDGVTDYLAITEVKEFKEQLAIFLEPAPIKRFEMVKKIINARISETEEEDSIDIERKISNKIKNKMTDQQREYMLREKLNAIKEELNELTGVEADVDELRKKLESNPYPDSIKSKVRKELAKLENTPSLAAESNVIRNYVDVLLDLPYWQKDDEKVNIKDAQTQLDSEHYGLEKVKERIIEYLAVRQIKGDEQHTGSILCLVGPPGVGKTTLAKSVAKALHRKFVKISLGGVKDESEIRGHRRTYVGAMPGKIITAMRKAGTVNPVILLDEIDKLSSDYKGDPTSALLEVLDYEQNVEFQDHYVEEDYDLSNVLFISTANFYENIPEVLRDRLEIITLSSYTELEKIAIAQKYLVNEVIENVGLSKKEYQINDDTIQYLIQHYTLEAGVRGLKRTLEQIGRKILVKRLNKELSGSVKITPQLVRDLIGKEKVDFTKKNKTPLVGVVTGLAWTPYGGDILPIEVTLFKGEGKLIITGQLEDIMQESANIALGYIKANAEKFEIDSEIFKNYDIHIHCPDGATPKDGPSAGVTFTTAIISAITKREVSQYVAMTGEITLRGLVLPIGGLREKSISAYRSKLKTILIPLENEKDLDEIPDEVKKHLEIIPIEYYRETYDYIFYGKKPARYLKNIVKLENQKEKEKAKELKKKVIKDINREIIEPKPSKRKDETTQLENQKDE